MTRRIARLLIANRGEIAVRVIRACRELGIESLAVYSSADERALHTLLADRAIPIGPAPARESYLAIPRIVDAARRAGADAIHPGYGFLSENPAFAAACEEAGIVFIGPPADVIERLGSKIAARELMARAGVPIVPGSTPGDQSPAGIRAALAQVGFPALVKASAGGGGKGMRLVDELAAADQAIAAARREAESAFGDGTLYVERHLARPRHVEFQIVADANGDVVHVLERDCSIQRRHQKVVEESPSPALTPQLRDRMGAAAVAAARAAGYRNAGTVEFLLDGEGDAAEFYFLEVNTRLQVEHPVTELVTGVDLVHAQIRVAEGQHLPWKQAALVQRGHAIECRVYAEDPWTFLPQAGVIRLYREPAGPGLRVDAGVVEGSLVPVEYDPILSKLIVHAESREAALARAGAALRRYPILGVPTNIPFLTRVLTHPRVERGDVDVRFVDAHLDELTAGRVPPPAALAAAIAARESAIGSGTRSDEPSRDPWDSLTGWRM